MNPLLPLTGEGWTLLVDPDRGGKITSLQDPSGQEWLAQAAPGRPTPGAGFVDAEMAGWDECAPSIIACEVDGLPVPDHGSLWDRPFTVDGDLLSAVDSELGFEFSRRVTFDEHGVLLEYAALVTRPQPFLWAAHPQFVSPPGTVVELPAHLTRLVDVHPASGVEVSIDELVDGAADLPPGTSRKFYLHPDDRAEGVLIRQPGGASLTMTWSAECAHVGIWLDHADYSREPVLAVEPSSGYYDSLATAAETGLVPWLEPGVPFTWWVRLAQEPSC